MRKVLLLGKDLKKVYDIDLIRDGYIVLMKDGSIKEGDQINLDALAEMIKKDGVKIVGSKIYRNKISKGFEVTKIKSVQGNSAMLEKFANLSTRD